MKTAIDEIWDVYTRRFGNKFKSTIVGDDRDYLIWYAAIKGLVKKDIERGKLEVFRWVGEWFPNDQEFRSLCLGITEGYKSKIKNLTLRWGYLRKEEFRDNLDFRRAKKVIKLMSADDILFRFKGADNRTADRLFNEYFNRVVQFSFDELEEIHLMIEEKDNSSKENVSSILGDIKSFLK